ncbi:hypothetical protein GCM10027451_49540 [Geodermatophilus aquaeductus]
MSRHSSVLPGGAGRGRPARSARVLGNGKEITSPDPRDTPSMADVAVVLWLLVGIRGQKLTEQVPLRRQDSARGWLLAYTSRSLSTVTSV